MSQSHQSRHYDPLLRGLFYEVIRKDRLDQRQAQQTLALEEIKQVQDRMVKSSSKTLSGSYLEALGLGKPSKQGGRAKSLSHR